jgi:hypothetical protein
VKRFAGSPLRVTFDVMPDRKNLPTMPPRMRVAIAGAAMLTLMISAGSAWPQTPPPASLGLQTPADQSPPEGAPPIQQSAPMPPSAPPENPGLINEMGKFFEKSMSIFPPLKTPSETLEDWNSRAKEATKDAGDSLTRLAKPSSMVAGRMGCPVATNGAPDCKAGADKLCQAKGYKEGKSLDTDAAEKCSAKVYLPGYKRVAGDCRTENYVTRALCQ